MPQCGTPYITPESTSASDKPNVTRSEPNEPTCAISKSWLSIYRIVYNSRNVSINCRMVKESASRIIDYMKWHHEHGTFTVITNTYLRFTLEYYPRISDDRVADWLFVLHSLNFCLWRERNVNQWTVNGLTGYMALCYAVHRAINEGFPLWSPLYYSNINYEDLRIIFRSDDNLTTIPALKDRRNFLHMIGNILITKYEGTFKTCIRICDNDSHKLMHLLLQEFKPFNDKVMYQGEEVYIGCKAMGLLSDLWTCRLVVLDTRLMMSTMFIDYRSPQIFVHLGILRYSPELMQRFARNGKPLLHGSKDDMEIRCCSLVVCKMLTQDVLTMCECYVQEIPELKTTQYSIPIMIDNLLWYYRHTMDKVLYDNVPYHYVRSLRY